MKSVNSCEVCAVLPTIRPIFETDHWIISLFPDQGYLGHCYVTLKEHKGDLAELDPEEWTELGSVIQRLESATRSALGATMFNWSCLMNNAYQNTPALPHIHWHFRPRYDKSVIFDGIEFSDPHFGHHYDRDQKFDAPAELIASITAAIRTHLH